MAGRKHTAEQILAILRQIEVAPVACSPTLNLNTVMTPRSKRVRSCQNQSPGRSQISFATVTSASASGHGQFPVPGSRIRTQPKGAEDPCVLMLRKDANTSVPIFLFQGDGRFIARPAFAAYGSKRYSTSPV